MPAQSDALEALRLIRESAFKTGPAWEKAHEIAQTREGMPVFDAIHALLHRIEGDTANAGYWDRRAGTDYGDGGPEAEFGKIVEMARSTLDLKIPDGGI